MNHAREDPQLEHEHRELSELELETTESAAEATFRVSSSHAGNWSEAEESASVGSASWAAGRSDDHLLSDVGYHTRPVERNGLNAQLGEEGGVVLGELRLGSQSGESL